MSEWTPDPLPHAVVRASAGAGKTYQLTTRYLQLIARHEPAQNVLATTFTRKAAGEVLGRVLGRLALACAEDAERVALAQALNTDATRARCVAWLRSLVEGLNRLSVGTIDGFFNRAAGALSLELALPPDPRLIDEASPQARQMRIDAIHAVLGEQADRDDGMTTLIEMLRRLHHDTAQRSVTDAIDRIVTALDEVYRSYPDRRLWDTLQPKGRLTDDLLGLAIEGLEAMRDALPLTAKGTMHRSFRDRYEELLIDATLGHWDRVIGNGLVAKIAEGATSYSRAPIDDNWHQAIRPIYVHAKSMRIDALAEQTRATYELLDLFHHRYKSLRLRERVLLFSDLTHALAEGLPNLGDAGIDELCYRLDARVTHLLLDEFQDTSLKQWAVLEPFAQQIAATSDASRSLFVVGDAKQAIYGWRGGCAELFDAVEALPGVTTQTLSKSWRSSQTVLDAVNAVFLHLTENAALADCRRAAERWQAGFQSHEAVQRDLPGHVVLRTTARPASGEDADGRDDDDEAAPPDAHAHRVGEYIRELVAEQPGRSIGVLMRSRAKGRALINALRGLGVAAAEEGGNPIANTPAVSVVLSAIQLADHPGDRVARFHVVNSPLAAVIDAAPSTDFDALSRRLRRTLIDRGYASTIASWVRELAPSCDAASLGRLTQLIELAEVFDEEETTLRPSYFVEAMRAAKVEDASPEPVRVMTIHASKGLEFDAVVLPDLDATLSAQDSKDLVVLSRDSPIDPVRAVYRRAAKGEKELLPEIEAAHEQHAQEKRTEDLCLLYVAMTRARQSLHLLVRPLKQGKNGKATTAGRTNLSYAAVLRQALAGEVDEGFGGDESLYESGEPIRHAASAKSGQMTDDKPTECKPIRLAKPIPSRSRSWAKTSPSEQHNAARVSARDLLSVRLHPATAYGTAIHALFEHVADPADPLPDDATLLRIARAAGRMQLEPERVVASFKAALDRPAIRTLIDLTGVDTLWRERRFMTRLDGRLVTGSFDRVHLYRESGKPTRATIIDFKTDRIEPDDADRPGGRVAAYAEQLRLYRSALNAMLGIEVSAIRTVLCFVGDGIVAEVD
ncbi:MAG: UvrD-helicase domain-containing protein [Phycisphaeraceae bacterium]